MNQETLGKQKTAGMAIKISSWINIYSNINSKGYISRVFTLIQNKLQSFMLII